LSNTLANFPNNGNELHRDIELAKEIERNLDGMLYYLRRQLNLALSYPELCVELGIESQKDFIHYSTAFSNFERIGDLDANIMIEIKEMLEEKMEILWPNLEYFEDYYKTAHQTVFDALDGRKDRDKRLKVVLGKYTGWKSYDDLFEKRKRVINWIDQQSVGRVVRHLTRLSDIIWGIPGSASNICEAWYNMDRKYWKEGKG